MLIYGLSICAILLAVYLAMRFRYRIFVTQEIPLVLFALTGIPDALLTIKDSYLWPSSEANPLIALFLSYPYLIVLGIFLWTIFWISIAEFFEKTNKPFLSRLVLLTLSVGHFAGFISHTFSNEYYVEITSLAATFMVLVVIYYMREAMYDAKVEQ